MTYNPAINIQPVSDPMMGFIYGEDVFGPAPEYRYLSDIRQSLQNPDCNGPDIVYAIAMDVGKTVHKELLNKLNLLFGVVTYATGQLGDEPVRSQGHIHAISPVSGSSTPEVYEIWDGDAIIYMQETADDDPGRCFAVYAQAGDVVIVPPAWAHATISANPNKPLTFGAWCDRHYGFDYQGVRRHKGLAWFPVIKNGTLQWERNLLYKKSKLDCKPPRKYSELGIISNVPVYQLFESNLDTFLYVPTPQLKSEIWKSFIP